MVYLRDTADFISCNEIEIRKMVNRICFLYKIPEHFPDILQEFYVQFISRGVLQKYDPKHPSATKISTYLYRAIENLVRVYKISNEFLIKKHEISLEFPFRNWKTDDAYSHSYHFEENQDSSACVCYNLPMRAKVCVENMNYRNQFSDSIDGMSFDLNLFEDFLDRKNKFYALKKRKNKAVDGKGLSLLKAFQLMQAGHTNREIARKYGVSDMFITTVKEEIKDMMIKFGIVWSYRKERDKALSAAE